MIDNRSPEVRFFDDIRDLARMASIAEMIVDSTISASKNSKIDGQFVVIRLCDEQIDNISFVIFDLWQRANRLVER